MIPPKQNADFVYHMEQVLAVYERPYDAQFPVVCLDESPKQFIEVVEYRAADATRIQDSEYVRHGVGEIYMAFEPLAGRRFVRVEDDHKATTWVVVIAGLLDGPYADCRKMTLVGDNLSAHKPNGPPYISLIPVDLIRKSTIFGSGKIAADTLFLPHDNPS